MLFNIWSAALVAPLAFAASVPRDVNANAANLASLIATNRAIQVDAGKKPSGRQAMIQAYQKYGWTLPSSVQNNVEVREEAATATQTGTVTATDLPNDRAYYVNVKVGQQTMLLNMDTGSSDLWGFSTAMPASQRGKHKLYKLEGKLASGETWNIEYAEGSGASGIVYADKVAIGKVTATVQAVEAATSVSSSFTTGLQDGIVGLGFGVGNTCTPYLCYTFMQQVAPTLPSPIFAATLRHNAPGSYDFGFIDKSRYTGKLSYSPLTGNLGGAYWEFNVAGYSVGSAAKVSRTMDFIADTGTSLLITDDPVVNAFYASVPSATFNSTYGGVVFPCSSASKLKNLSFFINGVKHTMPGAYGVYAQIGDPANTCFGGVQSNSGSGFTIMGDVFLKSQYVVFDVHTPQIGFAPQAGVKL